MGKNELVTTPDPWTLSRCTAGPTWKRCYSDPHGTRRRSRCPPTGNPAPHGSQDWSNPRHHQPGWSASRTRSSGATGTHASQPQAHGSHAAPNSPSSCATSSEGRSQSGQTSCGRSYQVWPQTPLNLFYDFASWKKVWVFLKKNSLTCTKHTTWVILLSGYNCTMLILPPSLFFSLTMSHP